MKYWTLGAARLLEIALLDAGATQVQITPAKGLKYSTAAGGPLTLNPDAGKVLGHRITCQLPAFVSLDLLLTGEIRVHGPNPESFDPSSPTQHADVAAKLSQLLNLHIPPDWADG